MDGERLFDILVIMRRLTEPEAHRARAAIIEGDFPEGMHARCARCRSVKPATDGEFVSVTVPGTGPMKMFKCSDCRDVRRDSAA